jgi:hypothetical protein
MSFVHKLGLRYLFDSDKFSLQDDMQDELSLGNKVTDKIRRVEFELHVTSSCTQAQFLIAFQSSQILTAR